MIEAETVRREVKKNGFRVDSLARNSRLTSAGDSRKLVDSNRKDQGDCILRRINWPHHAATVDAINAILQSNSLNLFAKREGFIPISTDD
jgi:hypothetical protein